MQDKSFDTGLIGFISIRHVNLGVLFQQRPMNKSPTKLDLSRF